MFEDKISAKVISDYLKRFGWKNFEVVKDTNEEIAFHTGWKDGDNRPYVTIIQFNKKSSLLSFVIPGIAKAPQDEILPGQLSDILVGVGFANLAQLLGRFSYEPKEGDIRFGYAMPSYNDKITYKQFKFIMEAITHMVTYWGDRIRALCEGERTSEDVIQSFVGHLKGY